MLVVVSSTSSPTKPNQTTSQGKTSACIKVWLDRRCTNADSRRRHATRYEVPQMAHSLLYSPRGADSVCFHQVSKSIIIDPRCVDGHFCSEKRDTLKSRASFHRHLPLSHKLRQPHDRHPTEQEETCHADMSGSHLQKPSSCSRYSLQVHSHCSNLPRTIRKN